MWTCIIFIPAARKCCGNTTANPPDTVLGAVTTEIWNALPWTSAVPFGTYAWYWQEKGKGACSQNWLLGSDHGGWKFNSSYDIFPGGMRTHLPPARAATNTTTMLQTNAFFDFGNYVFSTHPDYVHLQGSDGSSYAQTNRNRILSDAIPALSLVAGANPVQILGATHNFNMSTNTFENNWPQGRLQQREGNNWHHSDFHEVAYIFTWPLFDKFVTLGNLK